MNRAGAESLSDTELSAVLPNLDQPERIDHICRFLNSKPSFWSGFQWNRRFMHQFASLPNDCRRDVALSVRAREQENELRLLETTGSKNSFFLFDSYGTFVIPGPQTATTVFSGSAVDTKDTRVIVSTPTWSDARECLQQFRFGEATVLLPETITIAGEIELEDLKNSEKVQTVVENNLQEMLELSRLHPRASFVVGSPDFVEGVELPYNAAFHIQNGEIVGVVYKHEGTPLEQNVFSFDRNRQPYTLDRSAILVCKDLVILRDNLTAEKFGSRVKSTPEALRAIDKFVESNTEELLVSSCWSVGGKINDRNRHDQRYVNGIYEFAMKHALGDVVALRPKLKKIIMCDRLSAFPNSSTAFVTGTKLLSMVAFRPHDTI